MLLLLLLENIIFAIQFNVSQCKILIIKGPLKGFEPLTSNDSYWNSTTELERIL